MNQPKGDPRLIHSLLFFEYVSSTWPPSSTLIDNPHQSLPIHPSSTIAPSSIRLARTHVRTPRTHSTLTQDERRLRQQVKLLLLGAGASGKSTVLKQMRLIHNVKFTDSEVECECCYQSSPGGWIGMEGTVVSLSKEETTV